MKTTKVSSLENDFKQLAFNTNCDNKKPRFFSYKGITCCTDGTASIFTNNTLYYCTSKKNTILKIFKSLNLKRLLNLKYKSPEGEVIYFINKQI